jgi:hypothetical protein
MKSDTVSGFTATGQIYSIVGEGLIIGETSSQEIQTDFLSAAAAVWHVHLRGQLQRDALEVDKSLYWTTRSTAAMICSGCS